jgi:Uma2 family endonuclease
MTVQTTTLMTTEEFLELPEDPEVDRELIDGLVVEYPRMTTRNPKHSITMGRIGRELLNWLDADASRIGVVPVGDVRCRLATDPDSIVGIDVAYFEGPKSIRQSEEDSFFDGPPILAVEVLSPSNTHEEVNDKRQRYLAAGTRQVWIVDPDRRNVIVHRQDGGDVLFNLKQELIGDPDLPGFRCHVADFFSPQPQHS